MSNFGFGLKARWQCNKKGGFELKFVLIRVKWGS